jgi:hypothetical protein
MASDKKCPAIISQHSVQLTKSKFVSICTTYAKLLVIKK